MCKPSRIISVSGFTIDSTGVEHHCAVSDAVKVMLDLKTLETRVVGQDVLQEPAKLGEIPLALTDLVHVVVLSFLRVTWNVS
jgi:hypothetical protein